MISSEICSKLETGNSVYTIRNLRVSQPIIMSDKKLLSEIKKGNAAAFRQLVDLYKERVINTGFRFLANREDAEDVAQEVFIEVFRSISGFREEANLSTWIYRITVSKTLDLIRRRKRRKRLGLVRKILRLEDEAAQLPAPENERPDEFLENKERILVLNKALDSLPENQRVAITLSKYDAFSNQEVADIMATSVSAVEALTHRARQNLKKRLHKYFDRKL